MIKNRVKIGSIINNQLPEYIRSEFPLVQEFLEQYYRSLETNGNPYDLMNNIDQYVKVDNISNLIKETFTTQDINLFDTDIFVSSTIGFPEKFGLIRIDNEIIVYESKTEVSFNNCYRGFSGVTSYNSNTLYDELEFSTSSSSEHNSGALVTNLNSLLLSEFFNKIKKQVTPGFENRDFYSGLDERLFVKESNSFYRSKGTSESFRILFGALYGKPVQVILPRDFLFEPSDSQYRITKDIVVEVISGDPTNLVNKTLYDDTTLSRGTITKVEKITKFNNELITSITEEISPRSSSAIVKEYYRLSLDYDYDKDIEVRGTVFGEFRIHPKTKLINPTVSGQTHLDVDSTVGFKDSGELLVDLENGSSMIIQYKSKSLTQFFDCTGINRTISSGEEIKSTDYAYAIDEDSQIKLRITGVVSSVNVDGSHNLLFPGNTINTKYLGLIDSNNIKLNNWIFNNASKYKVEKINVIDEDQYLVFTYDENNLTIGDKVVFVPTIGTKILEGEVLFSSGKEVSVILNGKLSTDNAERYTISRKLSKLSIYNYPELSIYNANVENTYYDKSDDSVYVSSSSLPNYGNENIKINDFSSDIRSFSKDVIKFKRTHSFLTGDNIILKLYSDNSQFIGFAKKISSTEIKIAKDKDSIVSNNYIDFSTYPTGNGGKVEFLKYNYINPEIGLFDTSKVQPQKLIRKIIDPTPNESGLKNTETGPTGIFINGVEIQNYKSEDYVYYGPIQSIDVLSGGFGYDVINPPQVIFSDQVGYGASAICSVIGSLERIDILNPGFDYIDVPTIEITGGNGYGAEAEASLIIYDHVAKIGVNSTNVSNQQITFDTAHKFSDFEKVIYETSSPSTINGLSKNSTYFVKVVGINTIKLYSTYDNALLDQNIPVSANANLGIHQFRSFNRKRKISNIKIINSGTGYTNRKQIVNQAGINTSTNIITIKNHRFTTGEVINYSYETNAIGGLTNSNYYVKVLDSDNFRLYELVNDLNGIDILKTDQYIRFNSVGGEVHYFNYPQINVSIKGKYRVPTLHEDSNEIGGLLQPIFRGEIDSIFVSNNGKDYGSQEILNYSKQPEVIFNSGNNAKVKLIITDGKITSAYVVNSGTDYNSPPTILLSGPGAGAKLTPIIDEGRLIDVKVISSGDGYDQNNTSIDVISAGEESKVYCNIKSWNICLPERIQSVLNNPLSDSTDDGFLVPSKYGLGIQYTHLYLSRELRRILGDINYVNGYEENSSKHSPIIGWAYDGNPIYGPYGFSNPDSTGGIREMISGYSIKETPDRPKIYRSGFFVEDYVFSENGDLDEHNGRFCVTPEFPNGTYAYFATFSDERSNGYKLPQFPYLIGNTYKSSPIKFNFQIDSNQDYIDLNSTNWVRNTLPYNQGKKNSDYDYFSNTYDLNIVSKIRSTYSGGIEDIKILFPGENYKVNDKVEFDNTGTGGSGASAFVSKISGVGVTSIICYNPPIVNKVEMVIETRDTYIGYTTVPHNIPDSTYINISTDVEVPQYEKVEVEKNTLCLTSGIGTVGDTGITTYINICGDIDDIESDDVYEIEDEEIKVLEVDKKSSRIKVKREDSEKSKENSCSSGTKLTEKPRKFKVKYKINSKSSSKSKSDYDEDEDDKDYDDYDFDSDYDSRSKSESKSKKKYKKEKNKKIYFKPKESIGVGTSYGVGINSTLHFSNPGVGKTYVSIPTKGIYLPDHKLKDRDKVKYKSNGKNCIVVSVDGGITTSLLDEDQELFVTKISDDVIGLSTVEIGINSEGNYSGIGTTEGDLLYFVDSGTEEIVSFETQYIDVLTVDVSKNIVTVSTAGTHGLSLLDNVYVNVEATNTKEVFVKYNEYNRRLIIDPISISTVSVENNSVTIPKNNFVYGEKVIFEEIEQISGLVNNSIYYVNPISKDEFKLATTKYNLDNDVYVGINSTGNGFISRINPKIDVTKYQKLKFNLSDSSLSYQTGGFSRQPSFKLEFFYDKNYLNKLYNSKDNTLYTLEENGVVGVSSDSYVSLSLTKNSPLKIYDKLTPIKEPNNPKIKSELIIDDEQINHSQINLVESGFNGKYPIIGITTNTFSYEVENFPEKDFYDLSNAIITYKTDSKTSFGPIGEVSIKNSGSRYKSLPKLSVISKIGKNANLHPFSNNIGKINKIDLLDIGYNYSCDSTIRPTNSIPSIISVNTLSVFDKIDVEYRGFSYTSNSDIIVIDGLTKKPVNDVKLEFIVSESRVNIIKNTNGINSVLPTLITIDNSNGVGISSIHYNESTKDVTLFLDSTFSDPEDFPFEVGSKVLVEGCNISRVNLDINEKNYNSYDFDYSLFELTEVNPSLGLYGAYVKYNVSEYLNGNDVMGDFDIEQSSASVIPEKFLPKFNVTLRKNNFVVGEEIISNSSLGIIEYWDPKSEILIVSTNDKFIESSIAIGRNSGCLAEILSVKSSEGFYKIDSNSIISGVWNTRKGFLNDSFQRIHDNDYYQYFSYELKSEIPIQTWNDAVSSLNHTSGFKKFSTVDIEILSSDSRIDENQNSGDIGSIYIADSVIDLDCVFNFDLARENILNFDGIDKSDRVFLNSRRIQDYILSLGNKVLIFDDISDQFSNEIRPENYSTIDTVLKSDHRYLKYFTRTFDRRYGDESMFNIVTILHDGTQSYIGQYGKLFSKEDLGFFDFDLLLGETGRLLFYPNKPNYNDYTICYNLFSVDDSLSGISTSSLGDIAFIQSYNSSIAPNTSSSVDVVSISSTYRSAKIHSVVCDDENEIYSSTEISLVHDGSDVYITNYGDLNTSYSEMGTFDASISGNQIVVSFTPNVSAASTYVVNSLVIGIGDTNSSGIGTLNLVNTYFESGLVIIQSSPTPSPVAISSYYASDYASSYNLVSIEDLTNNQYQFSEIITDYNQDYDELGQVEYGVVSSGENLGIITSVVEGIGLNKTVTLYFTPDENTDYEIRLFKNVIGNPTVFDKVDLKSATIEEGIGFYQGRFNAVKRDFELTHNQNTVFKKVFDGSSLDIIDVEDDSILVPNHYFSTGEKIQYNLGGTFGSPIGIGTTVISGIGLTDKLPSTLYVVKLNDLRIRVSASASEALKPIPEYLDLTDVGISTNHIFFAEKQNSKCLITIDNIIQSPVVSTSKTTHLLSDFTKLSNIIVVDDPLQIAGGDYLKINDEIVRSVIIGYEGIFNNILVDRQNIGTPIDNHSSGSVVTKVEANYNIVGNTIYFADAPRGKLPQENPLNPEEVDFEGLKVKSSFSGRAFLRSGIVNTSITPYEKNYVFDSVSSEFDGVTESYTITSNFENISGISTDNFITLVRSIFQLPERVSPKPIEGDYSLSESSGITSITFKPNSNTVDYDINVKNIPRGGIIISVGSTEGFGYQPLVSAGGTAVVSSAGTISSVSIGNSGSGYRPGIQTSINVGVKTLTDKIEYIGTAQAIDGHIVSIAITNPGVGYTSYYNVITTETSQNISVGSTILYFDSTNNVEVGDLVSIDGYFNRVKIVSVANTFVQIGTGDTIALQINSAEEVIIEEFKPPSVVIDSPLSYSNIPLIYSSSSPQVGLGTEAAVDLVVSQDSTVLYFEIKNYGYGYNKDDILTIDVGGLAGIPTNTNLSFSEFQLTVTNAYDDQFASWHLGKLTVIDPIDDLIDGRRRFFPIRIDGKQTSFESSSGSNLNLAANLIILINDVLQVPEESYIFNGGSVIEFLEPPLSFDDIRSNIRNVTKTKILFYEGTDGIDTKYIDILETIKVGDTIRLESDTREYNEKSRSVYEIISSDSVRTNLYPGPGLENDEKLFKNLVWCKQKDDIFISNVGFGKSTNNYIVSKARESYEPNINPSAYLIKDLLVGDTEIFVDNLETFFNSFDEIGLGDEIFEVIKISSQDEIISCTATPVVSLGGSITSISIDNPGFGYDIAPTVSISSPIGNGRKCLASAILSNSQVSDIIINDGGSGYSNEFLPSVLISHPNSKVETVKDAVYEGDFGIITGISTIAIGTAVVFDLFIPENSYIRNSEISGIGATNISGIQTGYHFVIRHSNVGNGLISLNESDQIIGIGTTFIDNVYVVSNVSIAETSVVGVGTTNVARVTVKVSDYNGLVSLGSSSYYGSYSWGRISNLTRYSPKEFLTYKNGIAGIQSSPIIQRYQPIKNDLYNS